MAKKSDESKTPIPVAAMRKQAPDDNLLKAKCPTLHQLLMPIWIDGKCKRQSASLRVRLVGGYYMVTLSCPTEGLETNVVTDSLVGLIELLEAKVSDPGCIWTPDFAAIKKTRQVRIESVE